MFWGVSRGPDGGFKWVYLDVFWSLEGVHLVVYKETAVVGYTTVTIVTVTVTSPLSSHHYTSLPLIFMGTSLSIMASISSFKMIQHYVAVLAFIKLVQFMLLICLCLPLLTLFLHRFLPVLPVCILILKWIWLWSLDRKSSLL